MRNLIIIFPLTLLLVWGWYGFAQIYGVIYNKKAAQWVNDIVMIVSSLSGFVNTLVFSFFAMEKNLL